MNRREFLELAAVAGTAALSGDDLSANPPATADKLIGMYVHEGWVFNHPYSPRTWTDADWHGYLDALHRLGYNLVTLWPQLETVPSPLTASDRAKLEQHARVIDMAHREFNMQAWVVICPNIVPVDDYARRMSFARRPYYSADLRVNPADAGAVEAMMTRREILLKPLAAMDALVIIDSDPGGYPGSTNAEFVDLLVRHRQLLDKLRPGGVELIYWAWAGWQAYARYYETGNFAWGTEAEFLETLSLLKERHPEPWGLARGMEYAKKLGLESKVINFNYGAIELEPVFPITNFGPHAGGDPYQSGRDTSPRGTQANAQTHCVQLPGTFAFARGARGLPLTDQDHAQFADDLVPGQGKRILSAWKALAGKDAEPMRHAAAQLLPLTKARLEPGPLKGLLLGDPNRFVRDLCLMLRAKAAAVQFMNAPAPTRADLAELVDGLERWQITVGYDGWWGWGAGGDLNAVLMKLHAAPLDAFFQQLDAVKVAEGATARERITAANCYRETETLRLIRAMKQALWQMPE